MNADPQLRDRLERAAGSLKFDTDRNLHRTHRAAAGRARGRRVRALALAAVIAVIAGALVWQLRPVEQDVAPVATPTGWIAYLDTQGSAWGVFGFDLATGGTTAISDESVFVLAAAWSPDGSRIAYIVEEAGTRYAVVIADADGGDPETIAEQRDTGAAGPDMIDVTWSPDGSRIAYSGRVVKDGVARRTILIVDADGTGEPAALDGHWESVSWSPDGARLLVSGFPGEEAPFDLYTIRPDGSDLEQLTDDEALVHRAMWSPDGDHIVFFTGRGDYELDIYVMNADGSGTQRLTDWKGLDLFPVWSPDGEWIAFASDRDAPATVQEANRSGEEIFSGLSLYVMRADGSDPHRLVERAGALPVSWTT